MESLALALVGLGLPVRRSMREPTSRYAAAMGLVGVAAEQAISAILAQTFGSEVLLKASSHYKTGREILADFRALLRNPVPRASFLTSGLDDPAAQLEDLLANN